MPEAGWALIDLLDKEGRVPEAHALGMRLHEIEPDPLDRARLLLEMARMDIDRVSPGSQVILFGPLAREHPRGPGADPGPGPALVRDSRGAEGIEVLESALRRHPDSPEAWDAWLTGLYGAYQFDRLAEEFARLPESMADDPRFAKHEGMVAQNARDWPRAVRAFRRAAAHEPYNGILWYRLRARAAQVGDTAELERVNRWYTSFEEAFRQMRPAYQAALAVPDLGRRAAPRARIIGWPTCASGWAAPTRRAPGIARCSATTPPTRSAWRPWNGSSERPWNRFKRTNARFRMAPSPVGRLFGTWILSRQSSIRFLYNPECTPERPESPGAPRSPRYHGGKLGAVLPRSPRLADADPDDRFAEHDYRFSGRDTE